MDANILDATLPAIIGPRDAGYDVRLGGIDVKVLKREDLIARVHD